MAHANVANPQVLDIYRTLDADGADTAASVIMKLRGETCDIDCLYCYEKRKEAPGGARISDEQVRRLGEIFGERPLAIELHGGEPLTVGKEHMATLLRQLAAQPTVVRVSIQTNALALDTEWLDLFDSCYPGIRIGISLDGDASGNAWRVDYGGEPVYTRVAAALELLAARGRHAGIIAAVTPAVLGRAEAVIDHLASFSAVNAVNFAPCFDSSIRRSTATAARRTPASRVLQQHAVSEPSGPAWAVTPDEYAEFVLAAGVRWVSAGHFRRIKLEPIVSTIRRIRGLESGFCHFNNLKCDHVFTLYPDGRFGSCDELPWPAAHLARLGEVDAERDIRAAQRRSPLLAQLHVLAAKCASCDYRETCGGGCLATRVRFHDESRSDDVYCAYRMRLVDGVASMLALPGDAGAARCQTLRWRPRAVNQMRDVNGFLARWDDPHARRQPATLLRSPYGNINTVGLPGTHEADDLDPAHPQWDQAIEPGARTLVEIATDSWGCVTYDSCEGHAYDGVDIEPRIRQLGILPRNRTEYRSVAAALCRVATVAERLLPTDVRLVIGRTDLTCESTGQNHSVMDVRLEPAQSGCWRGYFAQLDVASETVAAAMLSTRPATTNECACESETRRPAC
ncbi:MAG TPA: radical SAM protein [Actinocrinis sp.]|uniref:radical SAM/SPASM domain-containing protein n=1 Tax=Actinocrinis sp. TaxID=1920516 RepID=UPI002DDD2B8E|nr:radical SAM protein [Actinocrinis sp.]HEV2347005.1 radical SAM protein [Actinocrinis sp.]